MHRPATRALSSVSRLSIAAAHKLIAPISAARGGGGGNARALAVDASSSLSSCVANSPNGFSDTPHGNAQPSLAEPTHTHKHTDVVANVSKRERAREKAAHCPMATRRWTIATSRNNPCRVFFLYIYFFYIAVVFNCCRESSEASSSKTTLTQDIRTDERKE